MISCRMRYPPGARFCGSVTSNESPLPGAGQQDAEARTGREGVLLMSAWYQVGTLGSLRPSWSILNHLAPVALNSLQGVEPQDAM